MSLSVVWVEAGLDELRLDLNGLCRLAGVQQAWLQERLALGLLPARDGSRPEGWQFDAADLRRVRRLAGLERDFDAVPELAALVADLEDELAGLRAALRRLGGPR